jgi:hypothetical protein
MNVKSFSETTSKGTKVLKNPTGVHAFYVDDTDQRSFPKPRSREQRSYGSYLGQLSISKKSLGCIAQHFEHRI